MPNILEFRNPDTLANAWRNVKLQFAADAIEVPPDNESPSTQHNSSFLNLSTVPEINIELSHYMNVDNGSGSQGIDMPARDEIIARLRQLPEVLGISDSEIAMTIGISASLWSNYKAERTDVTIRPLVALELWKAFGVPMEWIYGGEPALAEPSLRAKLAVANRNAEAWLASRRPPQSKPYRLVLAFVVATGMSLFTGFHDIGNAVVVPGKLPNEYRAYVEARGTCYHEAGRKTLDHVATVEEFDRVYAGCMNDLGITVRLDSTPPLFSPISERFH